jgi:hypothetical protein
MRLPCLGYLKKPKISLKRTPTISAKKLHKILEKEYNIELSYFKVWAGKKSATNELHGTWYMGG